MVKNIRDFMQAAASLLMLVLILMLIPSCAGYQFGDLSRVYCDSTNNELRAGIKATLTDEGLSVGIDYCASVGLVDVLHGGFKHE